MVRNYQYDYFESMPALLGREAPERMALAALEDYSDRALASLSCLDVGGSAGGIDHRLAQELGRVVGIYIEQKSIDCARQDFMRDNLAERAAGGICRPAAAPDVALHMAAGGAGCVSRS